MVTIPPILVLIVCKVALAGAPDQNADATGSQNLEWATQNSMMTCQRSEVELYDPTADKAPSPPPNLMRSEECARAGVMLATRWDEQHRSSPWRVWRVGCPSAIVNGEGAIVGYKLPECGHEDTVICLVDSAI